MANIELTTVTGSDRTSVRNAFGRVQGRMFFNSIADAEAATIPADVQYIVLLGARKPGDAGPPMPCERVNYTGVGGTGGGSGISDVFESVRYFRHYGWLRSTDRYTVESAVNATEGGYWHYTGYNQKVYLEWFGGAGDLYIYEDEWSYGQRHGFVNPDATDNVIAWQKASRWYPHPAPDTGYESGVTIQLGHGSYYFSDTVHVTRANAIEGMGHGVYHSGNSRMYFASGKKGIWARYSGVGSEPPEGGLTPGPCVIRNVTIHSLGYGGQTDKHGIQAQVRVTIEHCSIYGFGGNGVDISGNVPTAGNANCFYVNNCQIGNNAVDGLFLVGGDANAGSTNAIDFSSNKRWGLNDQSFLGNGHSNHHAASNGGVLSPPYFGGPYRLHQLGGGTMALLNCYSESDQNPAEITGSHNVHCGLHAAGINLSPEAVFQHGRQYDGELRLTPPGGNGTFMWMAGQPDTLFTFGTAYSTTNQFVGRFQFKYTDDLGFGVYQTSGLDIPDADNISLQITPAHKSGAQRLPQLSTNSILFPKGFYYGGGSVSNVPNRRMWVNPGVPDGKELPSWADAYAEYRTNDLAVETDGKSLGRLCTTAGVHTILWTSGTTYTRTTVVRTAANRVYHLQNVPYNPDAWTKPGPSVFPTHTSGTQNYPEPNPLYTGQPGESATIPGWSWRVLNEATYPDVNFDDPDVIPTFQEFYWYNGWVAEAVPGSDAGTWCRNTVNDITYVCAAIPTQPALIYDQVWSMPTSTVEPTHTSGTVRYAEPNPDIDGSEPSTIPGYSWTYLGPYVVPAWARVGAVFYEGTATYDPPSIADGASDPSEITITVTGAALGDLVTSISANIDTQGLDFTGSRVSAANTVKTRLRNQTGTGGAVNLASMTVRARVEKQL